MRLLTLMAALAISTSAAVAQTPAVKSPSANNPAAPCRARTASPKARRNHASKAPATPTLPH